MEHSDKEGNLRKMVGNTMIAGLRLSNPSFYFLGVFYAFLGKNATGILGSINI